MQGAPGQRSFLTDLQAWFDNCPLFTKSLIYICSITTLLHMFTGIAFLFINIPSEVIHRFGFHRLFLSPFFFTSILNLFFGFFSYLGKSAVLEHQWGTVKTIVDFFWKNFFVNVLFVLVMGLLSLKWPQLSYFDYCYGLWPIVFTIIMEQSLENPDGEGQLMCLPIIVKNKYYPLFLWLLFSLLSQRIKIDLICAMLVGLIHNKWLNPSYFNYLNDRRMASWSKSCVFNCLRSFKNYIPGHLSAYDIPYGRNANNNNHQSEAPSVPNFQAFQGRGVTIGTDDTVTNQNPEGYYVAMPENEITNNRPQQNQY